MKHLLSALALASVLVLGACDTMTDGSAQAAADVPVEATASKSSTCSAPTISVNNPTNPNQAYVITVTSASGNVAASVEEKLSWGSNYVPKKGASFSNASSFTYVTDWGPADGRPEASTSYKARSMCSNGQLSGYSNTITVNIAL